MKIKTNFEMLESHKTTSSSHNGNNPPEWQSKNVFKCPSIASDEINSMLIFTLFNSLNSFSNYYTNAECRIPTCSISNCPNFMWEKCSQTIRKGTNCLFLSESEIKKNQIPQRLTHFSWNIEANGRCFIEP